MARSPAFMKAYPLTARAAVHTPLVFRAGLLASAGLPWPSLDGIRDFAHFAGIEDGSVRTALSRARADGSILAEADEDGRGRYRLSPSTFAMGSAQTHVEPRPEGFLVAVFSFKAEDREERAALRNLLKSCGFRKLAQNTYIHGRIDATGLRAAVRALGLERHFFLFTCPDIEDGYLVARILDLFDLEARRKELRDYLSRIKSFLPGDLARDELARRLLYVGAVHWERIEAAEPPIPARLLPRDYAFQTIQAYYAQRLEEGRSALLGYYRDIDSRRSD